ncbi:MAG: hypothetical protein HFE90_01855 [Firmicutes bacterium]|nr:hypothetical protein [Bacillota bacterium]
MKSKTSFFRVSLSIIKEDFRKFWAIPVLAFIGYFLSGIFYILVNYKAISEGKGTYTAQFIENMLNGQYPVYTILFFGVPILSTILIFKYLHSSGSVMSVHSQPFTRNMLLNSHAVSCLLFSVLPIILTGIILLIIAQPAYYPQDYYSSSAEMENVFSRIAILKWMWQSFIISAFVIAVSLIGTMATGTSLHNAIAAVGFNVIVPGCMLISGFYFNTYLFGYVTSDNFMRNIVYTSPISAAYMKEGFSPLTSLVYIIVIITLYAFVMFLYNKRKLERATDGVVFKSFDIAITLIFGYLGMTGLGAVFYTLFRSSGFMLAFGYIAGALLSMIICRMIVMKTIRIFTKESIKIMASYAIFALIFLAVIVFDFTGYEKRIPANAEAASISCEGAGIIMNSSRSEELHTDKEAVELIKNVHKFIVDNKNICEDLSAGSGPAYYSADGSFNISQTVADYNGNAEYEDYMSVRLKYYGKASDNESKLERYYMVPSYLMLSSEEFNAYMDNESVRKDALKSLPSAESMVSIQMDINTDLVANENTITISDKDQIRTLMEALKLDINTTPSRDLINNYNRPILISGMRLQYDEDIDKNTDKTSENEEVLLNGDAVKYRGKNLNTTYLDIPDCYVNTMAWLQANGYGDMLKLSDTFKFAAIHKIDAGSKTYPPEYEKMPESTGDIQIVTDTEQLNALYKKVRSHSVFGLLDSLSTDNDDVYMICFYRQYQSPPDVEEPQSYTAYFTGFIKGSDIS